MVASKSETLAILRDFVRWIPVGPVTADLIDRYASEVLIECDSAVGHGPGHSPVTRVYRLAFEPY